MKCNWRLILLAALCTVPALIFIPNRQQEVFAQTNVVQTVERCALANPGNTREFMCADGERLRLYSGRPFLIGHYIEVVPDVLVEWNPVTHRAVRQLKLKAGRDDEWSDWQLDNGVNTATYGLVEKVSGPSKMSGHGEKRLKQPVPPPATFGMTAYFGVVTSAATEEVMCTACSGGTEGVCQNAGTKACVAAVASGACERRYSKCTEVVIYERDTALFSAVVSNWEFQEPGNVLRYRLRLRVHNDTSVFWAPGTPREAFAWPERFPERPTTALVRAADGTQRIVNVGVTQTFQSHDDKTLYLDFEFPSWELGSTLYYQ